jgi:septal ring factor EnvC (AmiA/AmiB activator)
MEKKIITIEELAIFMKDNMASKGDIKEVKEDINEVKEDIRAINMRLAHLDARVGRIEADIHELRDEVVHRHEFDDALARIKYLEKKLGIESGV